MGNPGVLQIRARGTADRVEIVDVLADRFEETFGPPPFTMQLREITFLATKRRPAGAASIAHSYR